MAPDKSPNLHDILQIQKCGRFVHADIGDRGALNDIIRAGRPEVVFHLAAQALVRRSYATPVETFAANVIGTVTLLDAIRHCQDTKAVVVVTSDKVYENMNWPWGYRESDILGGHDPYSASKACAEIATSSMRSAFFGPAGHHARIATARAGNVIGGGDWAEDRLVPDIVRGCLGPEGLVRLRNPHAVRPWQHVLEPLGAYISLAEHLYDCADGRDEAWNIGPNVSENCPVSQVAAAIVAALGQGRIEVTSDARAPHEANQLALECAKARDLLGWRPRLRLRGHGLVDGSLVLGVGAGKGHDLSDESSNRDVRGRCSVSSTDTRALAQRLRSHALRMTHRASASHIGSCLSIADVLAVLYGAGLSVDPKYPTWPERDRLTISKGHAAAIVYAALAEAGFFPIAELDRYCADGGPLSGHVTKTVPGVELSTGSLGHGLPVAAGMALAAQRESARWRSVCILSDGEMDEGSNWEAIQFAQHFRLSNLIAIVDYNKIQSFGSVAEVSDLDPLAEKFRAFNWGVHEIDGHDHNAIAAVLEASPPLAERPTAIVAHTVKGKGVSFMEGQLAWHYKNPDRSQLEAALAELGTDA